MLMSAIIAIIAVWATLTGCTTTADYTLGEELKKKLSARCHDAVVRKGFDTEKLSNGCSFFLFLLVF